MRPNASEPRLPGLRSGGESSCWERPSLDPRRRAPLGEGGGGKSAGFGGGIPPGHSRSEACPPRRRGAGIHDFSHQCGCGREAARAAVRGRPLSPVSEARCLPLHWANSGAPQNMEGSKANRSFRINRRCEKGPKAKPKQSHPKPKANAVSHLESEDR